MTGTGAADTCVFVALLTAPAAFLATFVFGVVYQYAVHAFMIRVRTEHVESWVAQGLPWHSFVGQVPLRTVRERELAGDAPRRLQTPSLAWIRGQRRELLPELRDDLELVRYRRVMRWAWLGLWSCVSLSAGCVLAFRLLS